MKPEVRIYDIGMQFSDPKTRTSWRPVSIKIETPFTDMEDVEHCHLELIVRVPTADDDTFGNFNRRALEVATQKLATLSAALAQATG